MRLLAEVVTAVVRRPFLIVLFLAGNAALFAMFWLWLSMPDRTTAELVASAGIAVLIVLGGLWLYGATLAAFHGFGGGYGAALRRLPRLLPWALALAAVAILSKWFVVAAVLLLLLPIASQAAGGGFSFGGAVRVLSQPLYWVVALPLGAIGVAVPSLLVTWLPEADGIAAQTVSMIARFGTAALLAAFAWLLLASLAGQLGRQASSQPTQ